MNIKINLDKLDALACLQEVVKEYPTASFSTSFGKEDQIITHLIATNNLPISIFTLDTGRLFEETYALFDRTIKKYKIKIQTFYPEEKTVQQLVSEKGPYSFYDSVDNRKECCAVRKIEPLKRAIDGIEVWLTGLRKEQSPNRNEMKRVEWDENNQLFKVHPIFDWSSEEMDAYITKHNIPINTLHAKGFPSIGCSSCTRAVLPGENERAGRWWWEQSHKECGLHQSK